VGRKSGTCSAQGEIPPYIVTGASMKSLNIITVNCILERSSTKRLKTKPKVISLASQSAEDTEKPMSQSKLVVSACSGLEARENVCKRVTIGFGLTSDRMKKWCEYFKPIV